MWELIKMVSWVLIEICLVAVVTYCFHRYRHDNLQTELAQFKQSNRSFAFFLIAVCLGGMYVVRLLATTWAPTAIVIGVAYLVIQRLRLR